MQIDPQEMQMKIVVVNSIEREENKEEINKRITQEEDKKKGPGAKKQPPGFCYTNDILN